MRKVILKTAVKREKGFLYFLDRNGDVAKVPMKRAGQKANKKQTVVAKAGVKRKDGYLYYIDSAGNICEAVMQRGGKKKKKR